MRAFDSWWLDVKLGIRMLVKFPGLTLSGVMGIAVAVAIAAGGYSLVQVNLSPSALPLEESARVVALELWDSQRQALEPRVQHDFRRWREALKSVQEISAYRTSTPNLILRDSSPQPVRVAAITASGFGLSRVQPSVGRYLAETDEHPSAPGVVVLGEALWRTHFAGDRTIVGRVIQLGAARYEVAGVMPAGFGFPFNHEAWIALRNEGATAPLTGPALSVFGRLAPAASLENAQAELEVIMRRAEPRAYAAIRPQVKPYAVSAFRLQGPGDMAGILIMQAIVVALLVLVCLNVAILTYTRTAMRQSEIGVRAALGASRFRLVMQLLVEALVLSTLASLAGVGIAALALRQLTLATRAIAADLPYWLAFRLSPEAVLYAGVLSVLAAAIIGILPGLKATARGLQTGHRVAGAGGGNLRLGKIWSGLIVAQAGFAVALLPTALLHVQRNLPHALAEPGFDAHEFLSAQLDLDGDRFGSRHAELMRRLSAEERLSTATFASQIPGDERPARLETETAPGAIHEVRFNHVAVNFLTAFEVPILAGRGLDAGDISPMRPGGPPAAPTVVVSQSLAERLFGGHALGQRIRYVTSSGIHAEPGRWYEIAGVAADFPPGVSTNMRDSQLRVYHAVEAGQVQPAAVLMRVRAGDAMAFGKPLAEIASDVDPSLMVLALRRLDDALRREQWIIALEAALTLAVTVSVLALCSVGIYSLMSFTVSQRRREIGIRMALGASRHGIVTAIFSRAAKQLGLGALLGAVLCLLVDRLIGDPENRIFPALLAMSALITLVGILAAAAPTRRTLRIQPTEALREE